MFPEYTFFNRTEARDFDAPEPVTGEYFSDVLTYRRLLTDPAQRWTLRNHYDLGLGSLSSKEFFENQKIALSKQMHPDWEARIIWFRDRDFEQSHSQFTIELIYWFLPDWGIAANGSPSFEKSDDDVGLALVNRGFSGGESRLFVNFPDFQLAKRSNEGETWNDGRSPLAAGFVSRSENHEWAFRHERATELNLPAEQRRYTFKRTVAQLKHWWDIDSDTTLAVFLFFENKSEGHSPFNGGTVAEEFRRRERFSTRLEWAQGLMANNQLITGLAYDNRSYSVARENFRTDNWLPYVWWTTAWTGDSDYKRRWKFGADSALFDASAPTSFLAESVDTYRIDSRINVALDLQSTDSWSLNFLFTFDADLGHSDTLWEGGAGQLRIYF